MGPSDCPLPKLVPLSDQAVAATPGLTDQFPSYGDFFFFLDARGLIDYLIPISKDAASARNKMGQMVLGSGEPPCSPGSVPASVSQETGLQEGSPAHERQWGANLALQASLTLPEVAGPQQLQCGRLVRQCH